MKPSMTLASMSFRVVGIDPGLDGGLTTLSTSDTGRIGVVDSEPMPTIGGSKGKRLISLAGVKNFLLAAQPDLVIIERVSAMPGQGVSSMFNFGYGVGLLEGIVFTLGLQQQFVLPQAWQKIVLKGIPRDNAKPSQIFCQRTFPNVDWRGTERSKVPHNGKTDSCCLAYYGLTEHLKTHGGA